MKREEIRMDMNEEINRSNNLRHEKSTIEKKEDERNREREGKRVREKEKCSEKMGWRKVERKNIYSSNNLKQTGSVPKNNLKRDHHPNGNSLFHSTHFSFRFHPLSISLFSLRSSPSSLLSLSPITYCSSLSLPFSI